MMPAPVSRTATTHAPSSTTHGDPHGAALAREARGVVEHVAQRALEARAATPRSSLARAKPRPRSGRPRAARRRAIDAAERAHQGADDRRGRAPRWGARPRRARELEELRDQRVEPLAFLGEHPPEPSRPRLVGGAFAERLGRRSHGGDQALQLVDEVLAMKAWFCRLFSAMAPRSTLNAAARSPISSRFTRPGSGSAREQRLRCAPAPRRGAARSAARSARPSHAASASAMKST